MASEYSRVSGRRHKATAAQADERALERRVARLAHDVAILTGRGDAAGAARKQVALDAAREELADLYR